MTLFEGIQIANALLALATQALEATHQINQMASVAQAEGREHFTPEEWQRITVLDAAARAQLALAIAQSKATKTT